MEICWLFDTGGVIESENLQYFISSFATTFVVKVSNFHLIMILKMFYSLVLEMLVKYTEQKSRSRFSFRLHLRWSRNSGVLFNFQVTVQSIF